MKLRNGVGNGPWNPGENGIVRRRTRGGGIYYRNRGGWIFHSNGPAPRFLRPRSHREVPLFPPRWGRCRRCGKKMEARLTRDGRPLMEVTNRARCRYELKGCRSARKWFYDEVAVRDGDRCHDCGRGGVLELDHEIPLWKVVYLPQRLRRELFLPWNLRLCCAKCHRRKTDSEREERASPDWQFRRLVMSLRGHGPRTSARS